MSALRSLRILDPLASRTMYAEGIRDLRYPPHPKPRKPRKKPAPPAAWQQRRREYLEECGRTECSVQDRLRELAEAEEL